MITTVEAKLRVRNLQREVRSGQAALLMDRSFASELLELAEHMKCEKAPLLADAIAHDAGAKVFVTAALIDDLLECVDPTPEWKKGERGAVV